MLIRAGNPRYGRLHRPGPLAISSPGNMSLLSIIVPTHERFRYAEKAVTALLDLSDEIEVVVSDTSEVDPWPKDLVACSGGRLKIVRPGNGISVVDNFNAALDAAAGDYVCFIGDDDIVTADAVTIARWASDSGVDAVQVTFPVLFYWPDYLHRSFPELYSGTLWVTRYSGKITPLDARKSLAYAAHRLGRGVYAMPRAYCGIVSRKLIATIVASEGRLFGGVSPDIYSAALIASYATTAVQIDFPIVIPGASGASTAGQSAAGGHRGALRDNDHIRPFRGLKWHPLVPEFYSVPTVWGFSLAKAVEKLPASDAPPLNWGRLYAQCLLYHQKYWHETWVAMSNYAGRYSWLRLTSMILRGFVAEFIWLAHKLSERASLRRRNSVSTRLGGMIDLAAVLVAIDAIKREGPPLLIDIPR